MKKNFTTLIILILLGATSPASFLPNLNNEITRKTLADSKIKKTRTSPATCVDFSGTWEGICENSDGSKDQEKIVLKQFGCLNLTMQSTNQEGITTEQFLDLAFGMQSSSSTSSIVGNSTSMAAVWNTDQTVISIEGFVLVKILGSSISSARFNAQVTKDGDQLATFSSVDGSLANPGTRTCKYNKK